MIRRIAGRKRPRSIDESKAFLAIKNGDDTLVAKDIVNKLRLSESIVYKMMNRLLIEGRIIKTDEGYTAKGDIVKSLSRRESIIVYLNSVEEASLSEIIEDCGLFYYRNTRKYVGDIITRLIARGIVERVKRGVYRIAVKDKIIAGKDQEIIKFYHK